jgi:hypothetical protein
MPHRLEGTFVIEGQIPGFREGAIVDMGRARAACYLTPEDLWLLRRYLHCLRPLSDPASAGASDPSSPEGPQGLPAAG